MKKFLCLILFLTTSLPFAHACFDDPVPDEVPMFLSNSITGIEPDFVSEYPDNNQSDHDAIVKEWQDYLDEEQVTGIDIDSMLFNTTAAYIMDAGLYPDLDDNTRKYLLYIKNIPEDQPEYAYKPKKRNIWDKITGLFVKKQDETEQKTIKPPFEKISDLDKLNDFLRPRYAYFMMKYTDDTKLREEIYKKYFSDDKPGPVVKYWAKKVYADYYRDTHKESDILTPIKIYLEVYNSLESYRSVIGRTIKWNYFNEKNYPAIMSGLKDDTLKRHFAYITGDIEALSQYEPLSNRTRQAVYDYTASMCEIYLAKNMTFLITGKEKDSAVLKNNEKYMDEKTLEAVKNEAVSLKKIVEKIMPQVKDNKAQNTWDLIYSFLAIISRDAQTCDKYLDMAEAGFVGNKPALAQTAVFRAFNALLSGNIKNDKVQAKLLSALETLKSGVKKEDYGNYEKIDMPGMDNTTDVYSALLIIAAEKFFQAGDIARSAACYMNTYHKGFGDYIIDIYTPNKRMQEHLDFVAGTEPQLIDNFLLAGYGLTQDDIHYVWAMKLVRDCDFPSALAEMEKIKAPDYWKKNEIKKYENWSDDKPDSYEKFVKLKFDGINKTEMDKKEMVKEFIRLSEKKKDSEQAANDFISLGNAFFYNDVVGYSDILWKGDMMWVLRYYFGAFENDYTMGISGWRTAPIMDYNETMKIIKDFYYNKHNYKKTAARFYLEAGKLTKDKEKAAKCLVYALMGDWGTDDLKKSGVFQELNAKYSSTEFYKAYLSKCSEFQSALGISATKTAK